MLLLTSKAIWVSSSAPSLFFLECFRQEFQNFLLEERTNCEISSGLLSLQTTLIFFSFFAQNRRISLLTEGMLKDARSTEGEELEIEKKFRKFSRFIILIAFFMIFLTITLISLYSAVSFFLFLPIQLPWTK